MASIGQGPHLLVTLTAYGFGHAAMTAPVVNALFDKLPVLRLTLQSNHPKDLLASRFKAPESRVRIGRKVLS